MIVSPVLCFSLSVFSNSMRFLACSFCALVKLPFIAKAKMCVLACSETPLQTPASIYLAADVSFLLAFTLINLFQENRIVLIWQQ